MRWKTRSQGQIQDKNFTNTMDEKTLRHFFAQTGLPRPDRNLHLKVHKLHQPQPAESSPVLIPRRWIYISASLAGLLILLLMIPPLATRFSGSHAASSAASTSSPRVSHGSSQFRHTPALRIVDAYLTKSHEHPGRVLWIKPIPATTVNRNLGTAFPSSSSFVLLRMRGALRNNQGILFPALTFWVNMTTHQVVSTTYGKTSRQEARHIAIQWVQLHTHHQSVIPPKILSVTKISGHHVQSLPVSKQVLPQWLWLVSYQRAASTGTVYINPFTGGISIGEYHDKN